MSQQGPTYEPTIPHSWARPAGRRRSVGRTTAGRGPPPRWRPELGVLPSPSFGRPRAGRGGLQMRLLEREPRSVYEVHDAEEFLDGVGNAETAGVDPWPRDAHRRSPARTLVAVLMGAVLGLLVVTGVRSFAGGGPHASTHGDAGGRAAARPQLTRVVARAVAARRAAAGRPREGMKPRPARLQRRGMGQPMRSPSSAAERPAPRAAPSVEAGAPPASSPGSTGGESEFGFER